MSLRACVRARVSRPAQGHAERETGHTEESEQVERKLADAVDVGRHERHDLRLAGEFVFVFLLLFQRKLLGRHGKSPEKEKDQTKRKGKGQVSADNALLSMDVDSNSNAEAPSNAQAPDTSRAGDKRRCADELDTQVGVDGDDDGG